MLAILKVLIEVMEKLVVRRPALRNCFDASCGEMEQMHFATGWRFEFIYVDNKREKNYRRTLQRIFHSSLRIRTFRILVKCQPSHETSFEVNRLRFIKYANRLSTDANQPSVHIVSVAKLICHILQTPFLRYFFPRLTPPTQWKLPMNYRLALESI